MTNTTKPINLLITPNHTLLGDEIIKPDHIAIVLENGISHDLDTIVALLEKHTPKEPKKPWFNRTKRLLKAIKIAYAEINSDKDH